MRAPDRSGPSGLQTRVASALNFMFPGMGGMGQLALNQLLVVMDGIDNPPFTKRVLTSRFNTFLDATYVVPRRLGRSQLRLPPPGPRGDQIYFIGATNVPLDRLDPALIRPGRMGRHVWFRTPTKQDRLDVFDLYITRVDHEPDLDTPRRRDEIARITNGYSPAMIDQVCSMALTIAHHDGRDQFGWQDLVEAMTTIESGTAIGIEYIASETRAVAIHEAGHAAAGHVFMKGAESTRLSIRMRGGSLGHHQALEKEERFSRFRSDEMARLVWTLGAMAAERVFYGENSNGVGGDVQSATAQAAWMVGASAMGPEPFEVTPLDDETEEEARQRVLKRFETIGVQIMNRTSGGGPFAENPIAGVLGDRDKRQLAAQILGQAYVSAYNLILRNKEAVEKIADELVEHREVFGDDLVRILDGVGLERPEIELDEGGSVAEDVTRRDRARQTSYRFRFGILYVALAVIVGAGVGTFVVLATRPAPPEAAAWSSWQPSGSKLARVRQIADRIPKAYKQPNGEQLTVSQASPLAVPTETGDMPVTSIFVRPDTTRGLAEESDIDAFSGAGAVSYGLCGLGGGPQCALKGQASVERFTLLTRQALELSLYTFKYVDGVDSVVVFMPPSTKGESNGSVFLRRSDVADELRRPISKVLPSTAPRVGGLTGVEVGNILRLTRPRTYAFEFQAASDGRPILVLTPPAVAA